MAEYVYEAVTHDGRRESASIQAPSAAMASRLLKEQGLLPTLVREKKTTGILDRLRSISNISLDEKIGFISNLAIMLKAGIPLARGISILGRQTQNVRFRGIIADVHSQVESGKPLGEAMAKYPGVFSDIFVSMVKVGELSGNLEKSLDYLNVQLSREAELRAKVKGAMIYPSVIVGAMVIIGVLMAVFVLPKLTSVFKDFNTDLPITTRIIMAIADFAGAHAFLMIGGIVAFAAGFIALLKTEPGGRAFDWLTIRMFVIGTVVRKVNLARFARILSSLLKSGIPIVQSLEVTGQAMGNVHYRERVVQGGADVKTGKPLSESLGRDTVLFPVLVVQMLQVGEESGTVEVILEELAGHYEDQVDDTLKNLSSVIEPILLLIIGGVVGFLALALIGPIYNISQTIN